MEKIKRIKSGVPGLDSLIGEGIPENMLVLISGGCGTGKTIMCGQFLYDGAKNNEPGIYVSLEEDPDSLKKQFELFGWEITKLEKEKKFIIIKPPSQSFEQLMTQIQDAVRRTGAKRLAIDSTSLLALFAKEMLGVRQQTARFASLLKQLDCTIFATTEIEEGTKKLSSNQVEEYIADGVIVLHYIKEKNIFYRGINIRKMKYTDHSTKIHPMKITIEGIKVFPKQELFARG